MHMRLSVIAIVSFAIFLNTASTRADDPMTLKDLFLQFQAIDAMAFDANVELTIMDPVPTDCTCVFTNSPPNSPIRGAYSHRVDGEKYRCDSYLDGAEISGFQTQVAFDGADYQLLQSDGTLILKSQDSPHLLPILPNPILELLQFCYPLTDATASTMVRIKDIVDDEIPSSFFDAEWVTVQDGSRELKRAIFPGGEYEGVEYEHYVYAEENALNQPVRIDMVSSSGMIKSTEFLDYIRYDVGPIIAYWPTTIVVHAFDPSTHDEALSLTYELAYLALEEPLGNEVFVINPASAIRIWDDDLAVFLEQ